MSGSVWQIAPGTPHAVHSTDIGRAMIKAAILGLTIGAPVYGNGQVQFDVKGITNATISYIVQTSSNLTAWILIQSNGGSFTFVDRTVTNFPTRFYRVTSVP